MGVFNTILELVSPYLPLAGTLLLGLLSKWGISRLKQGYVRGMLERATDEVSAAVSEVYQTYVSGIKKGRADGKLTDAEKAKALSDAIGIAKKNIGLKGVGKLVKIFGGDAGAASWLAGRVESAVGVQKVIGKSLARAASSENPE